jgi:hypothetical protein
MSYQANTFVAGEVPSSSKWQQLWDNDASMHDGTGLPSGTCVQMVQNVTTAVATGTTAIPRDDTIPQITEGTEFMTQAITPRSATNILVIEVISYLANSAVCTIAAALFQDSTANALAVGISPVPDAAAVSIGRMVVTRHEMVAGTTSATTFRLRAGTNGGGTLTFNGSAGGREYGAITKSSIVIREYTV